MNRKLATWALLALAGLSGCAICPGPDDYTYPTYGGRWQRHDPFHGRVGSAFTPETGSRVTISDVEPVEEFPEAGQPIEEPVEDLDSDDAPLFPE